MRSALAGMLVALFALTVAGAETAATPPPDDPAKISFMQYDPPSTLKVSEHPVARAKCGIL